MTDGKFTYDEIILGLKCLADEDEIFCKDCAFRDMDHGFACKKNVSKASLDLIRRQKAETDHFADIGKMYSEVRAEAIREFAERLLDKYDIWSESDVTEYQYVAELVNNLVKEMTEYK